MAPQGSDDDEDDDDNDDDDDDDDILGGMPRDSFRDFQRSPQGSANGSPRF